MCRAVPWPPHQTPGPGPHWCPEHHSALNGVQRGLTATQQQQQQHITPWNPKCHHTVQNACLLQTHSYFQQAGWQLVPSQWRGLQTCGPTAAAGTYAGSSPVSCPRFATAHKGERPPLATLPHHSQGEHSWPPQQGRVGAARPRPPITSSSSSGSGRRRGHLLVTAPQPPLPVPLAAAAVASCRLSLPQNHTPKDVSLSKAVVSPHAAPGSSRGAGRQSRQSLSQQQNERNSC